MGDGRRSDGASDHTDHVGYCTEAPGDPLGTAAGLYGPVRTNRVSFAMEPQEVRWVFRVRGSQVDIVRGAG
ncbi:hypothetical protein [Streptomyces spiramenti]|uniref:Uncharacterized protein n=1 Tax=Streptomyces spiramenti TaxID=2720606 RepID=A0ABX1ARK6_9ACTN|nr:hypothetical protein [Streptomyces spiramenti]NJP68226.1 hypothetical protein [Streptomyces spiramenti]